MPLQMLDNLKFHGQALMLRSERQALLAANIANADTPNFKARDFDFGRALAAATGVDTGAGAASNAAGAAAGPTLPVNGSNERHLSGNGGTAGGGIGAQAAYRTPEQASGDGNSVDMDRERANFADNAIGYEATLRFVNGSVRTMLSAIRGD